MPLVQAIIQALIQGLTYFIPVGSDIHAQLPHLWMGWEIPGDGFFAATTLGVGIALFIYFRHDWASIISAILRVLLLRKKPMILDERLPLFIFLASAPAIASRFLSSNPLPEMERSPIIYGSLLIGLSLPLWFFDSMSRRTKKLLDWNWLDSLWMGFLQILHALPTAGVSLGGWIAASIRNYNREAAAKFIILATMPLWIFDGSQYWHWVDWKGSSPSADIGWLSFSFAVVMSFIGAMVSLGSLMKWVENNSMARYAVYRTVLGITVLGVYWLRG